MIRVIVGRLAQAVLVIYLLLTLLFVTARLTGDPVTVLVGGVATAEEIESLKQAYGLNEPLHVQYIYFLREAVTLDFGESIRTHDPALEVVLRHARVSLQLVLPALIIALAIAVPIGCIAAVKRGTLYDAVPMTVSVLGQSVPSFSLAIIMILIFGVKLDLLPIFGQGDLTHFVMPVATLVAYPLARYMRLTRSQVVEVLTHDYIRTARGKGLSERSIVWGHALRNAMLPVISILGVELGLMISGAVIVERIFAWPGLGSLMLQAAQSKDYPVLQAAGFVVGVTVTVAAVAADLAYRILDPRLRKS